MRKPWIIVLAIAAVLLSAYIAAQLYANSKAEEIVDKTLKKLQPLVMVDYDSVSANPFTKSMTVKGITIKSPLLTTPIPVKSFRLLNWSEDENGSSAAHIAIEKIHFNAKQKLLEKQTRQYSELGYNGVFDINFEMDYTFDADDKKLDINKFRLSVPTVGSMDCQMEITGMDKDALQGSWQAGMSNGARSLPGLKLAKARITIEDDSLVDRLFTKEAFKENKSLEQWRKEKLNALDNMIKSTKERELRDILRAWRKFMAKPGKFVLTVNPPQPVGLDQLEKVRDPARYIKKMGIKASYS